MRNNAHMKRRTPCRRRLRARSPSLLLHFLYPSFPILPHFLYLPVPFTLSLSLRLQPCRRHGASAATPIWLTLGVFSLNHFVELQRHHELEEKVDEQAPVVLKTPKDKTPSSPA